MGGMGWMVVESPIGALSVASVDGAVAGLSFGAADVRAPARSDRVLAAAAEELAAYFAGGLTEFTVPHAAPRGSEFERAVWREMTRIPYGETRTYGEVATAVGSHDPQAARAVGLACNRNPIAVIVPCHRIVGAGGKLVGFGGGLPRKRFLLELEARVALTRDWSTDG
jgi:methylated-DNA-[protein]-cysteine S-methyltransferase